MHIPIRRIQLENEKNRETVDEKEGKRIIV
jgi:hypothetical protein